MLMGAAPTCPAGSTAITVEEVLFRAGFERFSLLPLATRRLPALACAAQRCPGADQKELDKHTHKKQTIAQLLGTWDHPYGRP